MFTNEKNTTIFLAEEINGEKAITERNLQVNHPYLALERGNQSTA